MLGRQQPRQRILDELGIAQKTVAIDEGVAHGLGHDMHRAGGMKAERMHVVTFQYLKNFAQGRTTR